MNSPQSPNEKEDKVDQTVGFENIKLALETDQTIGFENLNTDEISAHVPDANPAHMPKKGQGQALGQGATQQKNISSKEIGKADLRKDSSQRTNVFKDLSIYGNGRQIPSQALIGPYEILDELGRGGMGVVYRAKHVNLGRVAALKMIINANHVSDEQRSRFNAEAEAVAKLDHPNCVRVYDVGEHEGNPFIALELVEGGNLQKKADGKPQTPKYAATIVESIAEGIHAAHEKGIIHRDLKPANVLLTADGQPKVTDFGLAKNMSVESSGITNNGSIIGTPSYMAPEQAAGRLLDIGPRTDVYALGVILYELLVGHPPYRAESIIATIRIILEGELIPPATVLKSIPKDLNTICCKALEKPIHRRYATAKELAEDLHRFSVGEPILARPISSGERLLKWIQRKPTQAATIAAGIIGSHLLVIMGVYSYFTVTKRAIEAEKAKSYADQLNKENIQRLVRLNTANGTKFLDDQDYLSSVLWYAEALKLEAGGADREKMHRIRIATVLQQCPKLTNIWLHDGAINTGSFDGKGSLAITASDDGTAKVWELPSGKLVGKPIEHGSQIKFAELTSDGVYAITAGSDGALKCWDVASSKLVFVEPMSVLITGMVLSKDCRKIAVCGAAGRVRIWEIPTGKSISLMSAAFTERTSSIDFSSDSLKYVVGSKDGTLRVFKANDSEAITAPLKHAGTIRSVTFSQDMKYVASASGDGTAQIWDAATGSPKFATPLRHSGEVTSVAFSPDGKYVVTGSLDHTAQVWDLSTGRSVGRPSVHISGILKTIFSPNGEWYATTCDDNSCRVWSTETGNPVTPPIRGNALPTNICFSPKGHELLITRLNNIATVWDISGSTASLGISGNNQKANGQNKDQMTLQSSSGKQQKENVNSNTSPTSTLPATANPSHGVVELNSPNKLYSVSFGSGQTVRIRKTDNHEQASAVLRTSGPIVAAVFSEDSKTVFTGDFDGNVMSWSVPEGEPIWKKSAKHSTKVIKLAVSHDGKCLASTSEDNTIGIWSIATGEEIVAPIRLTANGIDVQFTYDGESLITKTIDEKTRIWDVKTGEPLSPFLAEQSMDGLTELRIETDHVDNLRKLGQILASVKVLENGGLSAIDSQTLRTLWLNLKKQSAHFFSVSTDEIINWHQAGLSRAETNSQWFAASWHLDALLTLKPDDIFLLQKRSQTRAKLGDWKKSEQDANQLIQLKPDLPAGWYQRGIAFGKQDLWEEAAFDFAMSQNLQQNPFLKVGLSAFLSARDGNIKAYQAECQKLLAANPNPSGDPETALRQLFATTLLPQSGVSMEEFKQLQKFAEKVDTVQAKVVVALCEIRQNEYDQAIKRLELSGVDKTQFGHTVYTLAQLKKGLINKTQPAKSSPQNSWHENIASEILNKEIANLKSK